MDLRRGHGPRRGDDRRAGQDLGVRPRTTVPDTAARCQATLSTWSRSSTSSAARSRRFAISITDRCNFRCVYCMPKEVYGRDHAFLERKELLSFEEIARRRRRLRRARRARRADHRRRAARAPERRAPRRAAARDSRARARADDERRAAAAEGRGARARRARPRHGQPRLGRRRDVPRAERRRLPRADACSRASTPPRPPACA